MSQSPVSFSGRRLFEPVSAWLERFDHLPDSTMLSALLTEVAPHTVTASGLPLHFDPAPPPAGYEAHIHNTGAVPTRPNDWHDFFNALAWCAWPQAKAALNAAHIEEIEHRRTAGLDGRGRRRDALTLFDECGMLVISSDANILNLLATHEWEAAFVTHRSRLTNTTRFLVFGHASWDQLRAPFVGLCAKTLQRLVPEQWLALDASAQLHDADQWLAGQFSDRSAISSPRVFRPLPLLGIPGVTPDNELPDYYRDTRQFRPLRG